MVFDLNVQSDCGDSDFVLLLDDVSDNSLLDSDLRNDCALCFLDTVDSAFRETEDVIAAPEGSSSSGTTSKPNASLASSSDASTSGGIIFLSRDLDEVRLNDLVIGDG